MHTSANSAVWQLSAQQFLVDLWEFYSCLADKKYSRYSEVQSYVISVLKPIVYFHTMVLISTFPLFSVFSLCCCCCCFYFLFFILFFFTWEVGPIQTQVRSYVTHQIHGCTLPNGSVITASFSVNMKCTAHDLEATGWNPLLKCHYVHWFLKGLINVCWPSRLRWRSNQNLLTVVCT